MLISYVNEITRNREEEKIRLQNIKDRNENYIINTIEEICKKGSKFNYASISSIEAEAEMIGIGREEVKEILNILEKEKYIYQPTKSCYRLSKVKP